MSVRNPRIRLISFRLSDDEYQALHRVCEVQQVRSVSEFVRTSICWIASNADRLPPDFFGPPAVGTVLGPDLESETLRLKSGAKGMATDFASAVVYLNRRTDALDREIRRLGLLLRRPAG